VSTADFIQRLPAPGDRWRGLSDEELEDIMRALLAYEQDQRKSERGTVDERTRQFTLVRDASFEMERRKPGWLDAMEAEAKGRS
jgi:hypothetical protein